MNEALPTTKLTVEGSITGSKMGPPKIVFTSQSGTPVLTINPDGTITLGDDAKPTEAAAECIKAMDHMIQNLIRNAVQKERERIVAWLYKEQEGHPKSDYSGFAAMIAEEIAAGEHLK